MSETDNNNVSNVADEVQTATVQTPNVELNVEEAVSAVRNKFGRDKVGEALDKAKATAPPPTPDQMTIEQLAEVAMADEGGHKGIDYNAVVNSLPEDAQKLMANLRADYTRKTQELSNQRKEVEAMRTSLMNSDFNKQVDEIANQERVELDPYDNASFEKRIEQEVATRLQEMMKPIRMEQELQTRRSKLEQFKQANPDMMEFKDDIASMLNDNEALSLQDAYYIVKGKTMSERMVTLEEENTARKAKMREAGLKIQTGSRGSEKPPKGLKGYEIYKWLEARKRG